MNDLLQWLRRYTHDLINRITCVIMSVDSLNMSFEQAMADEEVVSIKEKIEEFFIEQLNWKLPSEEMNIYKNSMIHFSQDQWRKCSSADDMYFCCRILYMLQLVFLGDYSREYVQEYIEMLNIQVEEKSQWEFSLYLVVLCFASDHNSDNFVTVDNYKIFFTRQIQWEINMIRCFVQQILGKNVVFEDKLICIY